MVVKLCKCDEHSGSGLYCTTCGGKRWHEPISRPEPKTVWTCNNHLECDMWGGSRPRSEKHCSGCGEALMEIKLELKGR